MSWWRRGRKKETEEEMKLESTAIDSLAVTPLPDPRGLDVTETRQVRPIRAGASLSGPYTAGGRLMPEQPAGDDDVCCCGEVELVYGGSVQCSLATGEDELSTVDGLQCTVLHRKHNPCEEITVHTGQDGTHRYV